MFKVFNSYDWEIALTSVSTGRVKEWYVLQCITMTYIDILHITCVAVPVLCLEGIPICCRYSNY